MPDSSHLGIYMPLGLQCGQPKAYLKMFIAALYKNKNKKTELQFLGVSIIYSSHTLYLGCMNEWLDRYWQYISVDWGREMNLKVGGFLYYGKILPSKSLFLMQRILTDSINELPSFHVRQRIKQTPYPSYPFPFFYSLKLFFYYKWHPCVYTLTDWPSVSS